MHRQTGILFASIIFWIAPITTYSQQSAQPISTASTHCSSHVDTPTTSCDWLYETTPHALSSRITGINLDNGQITPENAGPFIESLMLGGGNSTVFQPLLTKDNKPNEQLIKSKVTFIIHVVVWKPTSAGDQSLASPDQRWYVYSRGRLQSTPRIYGVNKFWLVYIHLNRGAATYTVSYDLDSTKATPQNIQNLSSLASIIFSQTQASSVKAANDQNNNNIWGAQEFNFPFTTSDISITPTISLTGGGAAKTTTPTEPLISSLDPPAVINSKPFTLTVNGAGFTKEAVINLNGAPLTTTFVSANQLTASVSAALVSTAGNIPVTVTKITATTPPTATLSVTSTAPPEQAAANGGLLGSAQVFHNEAASWWDVSLGFPVTNVNQLSFNSSSTVGALTPMQTDKKKLIGLLNFYPIPFQQRQISSNGFSWIPSVVIGLPLASQPLHKPIAGLSWGPPIVQFYIGAVVADQPSKPTTMPVIGHACYGWCPQFTFGINFGVKAIANKATGNNSQASK